MVRFAASTPALSALVALHLSRTGLRLSELAALVGAGVSTMQRALQLLLLDGVVERHGHRYVATGGPRTRASLTFAIAFLSPDRLARVLPANASVEYVGVDATDVVVITRRFPEPLDEARLRSAIDLMSSTRPDVDVLLVAHHEIRRRFLVDVPLYERMRTMTCFTGDPERYAGPGRAPTRPPTALGRIHPSVIRPSRSALRRFAQGHGLRRVVAFGSAVRGGDLRPSSDVDLLVEPLTGGRPSTFELSNMVADAEQLFGRDVDILVGLPRDQTLREAIATEGVVLHDAG